MTIVEEILKARGLPRSEWADFLSPNYDKTKHDPYLLPDMTAAVERIKQAIERKEKAVIYGDYDVDGISATAILMDALPRFGLDVSAYTPDRFTEGYGLNMSALRGLAKTDASLVITVDCGSLSHEEIAVAKKLKLDVIVTDHHAVTDKMPPAVAVINPHRTDSEYPFADLAGCGVAFKLVQALQAKLDGLPAGQEKWLLDLVALGTVCDIVPLLDENRNNVYWGIEVLRKTRRPGLKALMAVAKIRPGELDARKIGFGLGPRLNAAGRISTAKSALELLTTTDNQRALELAQQLDTLNLARRAEQDKIFGEAMEAIGVPEDDVIVVANDNWNEGVIGIVASKLMERYHRPVFVMTRGNGGAKGSGRSFGDFDLAAAIEATREHLDKGGGHAAAGGVSLSSDKIDIWRGAINQFYKSLALKNQEKFLLPREDIAGRSMDNIGVELVRELSKFEPFGLGNEKPIVKLPAVRVKFADKIGRQKNHLKMTVSDGSAALTFLAFDPPERWFVEPGSTVDLWVNLEINEWQGRQTVEGRILRLEML
jgi:single-stranded-DNA-specific exonuclease